MLIYDHVLSGVPRAAMHFREGRDVWWQDVIPGQSTNCPVAWVGAEHTLFKLYTSGSTGKPKVRVVGVVRGGVVVGCGGGVRWGKQAGSV